MSAAMNVNGTVLAVIVAMAVITSTSRIAGYWLSGRIVISERLETAMNLIPGTILTALVAPAIVTEGIGGVASAAAAVVVMRKTGNLIVTLLAGVGVLLIFRNLV